MDLKIHDLYDKIYFTSREAAMTTENTPPKDFESALKLLNLTVERMEKGGLSLESSLAEFEQGVTLIRFCQDLLKKAEQKIQIYNKEKNQLNSFNDPESGDGQSG